jgi:hypothetical protein
MPSAKKETRPDVSLEQIEPEYTSSFCPECVRDVKAVHKKPQDYLEVNMIRKTRVVDTFAVPITTKTIHYKKRPYLVDEKYVYLLPTKQKYLMPTAFYYEGNRKPVKFVNTNKGITGKALSLLYMPPLYEPLFAPDEGQYNLFIVILSLVTLALFSIGLYFVFAHNGGIL